jgi:hypothetical protein
MDASIGSVTDGPIEPAPSVDADDTGERLGPGDVRRRHTRTVSRDRPGGAGRQRSNDCGDFDS